MRNLIEKLEAEFRRLAERRHRRLTVTPKNQWPRCGALTRAGTPCQVRATWNDHEDRPANGRCRFHGGLSTGPKTPEDRDEHR